MSWSAWRGSLIRIIPLKVSFVGQLIRIFPGYAILLVIEVCGIVVDCRFEGSVPERMLEPERVRKRQLPERRGSRTFVSFRFLPEVEGAAGFLVAGVWIEER